MNYLCCLDLPNVVYGVSVYCYCLDFRATNYYEKREKLEIKSKWEDYVEFWFFRSMIIKRENTFFDWFAGGDLQQHHPHHSLDFVNHSVARYHVVTTENAKIDSFRVPENFPFFFFWLNRSFVDWRFFLYLPDFWVMKFYWDIHDVVPIHLIHFFPIWLV